MTALHQIWNKWRAFGRMMGDFVGRLVMTVFYFTIAAPFGLAVRFFSDPLQLKQGEPHWEPRQAEPPAIEKAGRSY